MSVGGEKAEAVAVAVTVAARKKEMASLGSVLWAANSSLREAERTKCVGIEATGAA